MGKNPLAVFQIRITLNGVKPPIWRRLLVLSSTDLAELHEILQIAMGWTDSHLHEFLADGKSFGVPDPDFEDEEVIPEEEVRIESLLKKEKQFLVYVYDFGDGWEHKVELEKILPYTAGEALPKFVAGRRACPPEDVGGIWGYQHALSIYKDRTHPEHEEFVEWLGEDFDPERFDLEEINEIFASEKQLDG